MRSIYHATTRDNAAAITAEGLAPRCGVATRESAAYSEGTTPDLVYFAEHPGSLPWQVSRHLGCEIADLTYDDLIAYGAVCVASVGPGIYLKLNDEILDHEGEPVSQIGTLGIDQLEIVEDCDFFAIETVVAIDVVTGERLDSLLVQFSDFLPNHLRGQGSSALRR